MGENVSFSLYASSGRKIEVKLAHPTLRRSLRFRVQLVSFSHTETSTEQAIKLFIKVARKIQLHQPNSPRYFAADVHRISLKNFNNFLIKKIR
jgi:hypothetical protein